MEETIAAELARAAVTGSRELDRICEQHAQRFFDEGVEPDFTVESADFDGDGLLICADRYWRLRFLDRPTVGTATQCAHWLVAHVTDEVRTPIAEKWALGYAFITRDNIESGPEVDRATGTLVDRAHGAPEIA